MNAGLVELSMSSKHPFVASLFGGERVEKARVLSSTVSLRFRKQLRELVERLERQDSLPFLHFLELSSHASH